MKSDIEIARSVELRPIAEVAAEKFGGLYGEGTGKGWMKQMPEADVKRLFKADQFNDYTVRVVGKRVTIILNGETVVDEAFPDLDDSGAGPATPGFLTRGVQSPETFYYRRLFTDAARAVEVAAELPGVDASRLVVTGKSQGGGLSLAAAGLVPEKVSAVVSAVPFLCDIRRAVTITDSFPFAEVVRFLRANPRLAAQTLETLDFVDVVHFAKRVTAPL